jgi:hypothetical protein
MSAVFQGLADPITPLKVMQITTTATMMTVLLLVVAGLMLAPAAIALATQPAKRPLWETSQVANAKQQVAAVSHVLACEIVATSNHESQRRAEEVPSSFRGHPRA